MQHVTITQVHVGTANTKNGPKQKVAIKTNIHGDQWLSAFDDRGFIAQKAKEGWSGPIVIDQNNGFLNFRFPTKTDYLEERIARLEAQAGLSSLGDRPAALTRPAMPQSPTSLSANPLTAAPNYGIGLASTNIENNMEDPFDAIPF